MLAILQPCIGVGDFYFGDPISVVISKYEYDIIPEDKYINDFYIVDALEMSFGVDDNQLIENIHCHLECIYKGRNIIGMTIDEFITHTGERYYGEIDEADLDEDNILQYIYEFEDIGLQVWEKGKGGKIICVIASLPYEE